MRVRVYRNLHKGCLSVMDWEPGSPNYGRVIRHTDRISLANVKFVVLAAGQAKVRATGRKNVHAFLQGDVAVDPPAPAGSSVSPYYNPYTCDSWIDADTKEPLTRAATVTADIRSGISAEGAV